MHRKSKYPTDWPEWHYGPLRLRRSEIQQPYMVLREFFELFDLPNLRAALKLWLDHALSDGDANASELVTTYDYVEKLVEAAWLLHERAEDKTQEPHLNP